MVDVPEIAPHAVPELVTVATEVLALLHKPPVAASAKEVDELAHNVVVPVMVPAAGKAFTVTIWVAVAVPQELVTV